MGQRTLMAISTGTTPDDFPIFRQQVAETIARNFAMRLPIFRVDAPGQFERFLSWFPEPNRQHYRCHACRTFFDQAAQLVLCDRDGRITPLCWNASTRRDGFFDIIHDLEVFVSHCQILRPYHNAGYRKFLGVAQTPPDRNGYIWEHLYGVIPAFHSSFPSKSSQADFALLVETINRPGQSFDQKLRVAQQAIGLLESGAFPRAYLVLPMARWWHSLLQHWMILPHRQRINALWHATVTAPAGYCHIKNTVLGTLLDDLSVGMDAWSARHRYSNKINPQQYQRPTAEPTGGQIDVAEKRIEELGIARSLERRFARFDEVPCLWRLGVQSEVVLDRYE